MPRFFYSLFFVFSVTAACSQPQVDSLHSFVRTKTDAAFSKRKVPGILVMYGKGTEQHLYTTGFADPDKQLQFNSNTFFEIGSITKTFTAYVLMSVLRDKKISDTSSILSFLPDNVKGNAALLPISFRHLMNHSSGLPRMPDNMDLRENDLQPYQRYDSKQLFEYLATAKPAMLNKYEYSNLGAALGGVLAERISGKTYAALLDKYIFLPFHMIDSSNTLEKSVNKSQGFIEPGIKAEYWNMNVMAPAGGLKCSGAEMIKYLQRMVIPTDAASHTIIDSLTSTTFQLSPNMSVGRGWHSTQIKGKPAIYWHNGGTYGFSTYAAFTKQTGHWVMVVVNHFDKNDTVSDVLGIQIMNKMLE